MPLQSSPWMRSNLHPGMHTLPLQHHICPKVSQAPATYLQLDLDMFFANFYPSLIGKSPLVTSGYDAASRDLDYQYGIYYSHKHTVKLNIVWCLSPGNVLSFNEWLSAVESLYCTSDGGDDYAYNPSFPNLPIGDLQEHTCGTISPLHIISNSPSSIVSAVLHPVPVQQVCEAGVYGFGQSEYNALQPRMAWSLSMDNIRGGTQVKANLSSLAGNGIAEEVWNRDLTHGFFESGGGGFSNHFPMPEYYQKSAMSAFWKKLEKTNPGQLKHFNLRGCPRMGCGIGWGRAGVGTPNLGILIGVGIAVIRE
ncbi:hypothetical protein B0H14DRAFT_2644786 [Mycena olivaceomarginata]|nr:hypothetical protein B0H14DRAFT_2644786 [Mycena olivaceomarginata]